MFWLADRIEVRYSSLGGNICFRMPSSSARLRHKGLHSVCGAEADMWLLTICQFLGILPVRWCSSRSFEGFACKASCHLPCRSSPNICKVEHIVLHHTGTLDTMPGVKHTIWPLQGGHPSPGFFESTKRPMTPLGSARGARHAVQAAPARWRRGWGTRRCSRRAPTPGGARRRSARRPPQHCPHSGTSSAALLSPWRARMPCRRRRQGSGRHERHDMPLRATEQQSS